jgi:drug/metabolite transporter (DMT)-like permease
MGSLPIFFAAVVTVLFWASAFAGIRVGLTAYSPAHVAVLRFLTASLVLGIYAIISRMRLPARRDLPRIAIIGAVGLTFYNLALNIGERSIPAGPASLLVQTSPIWTALLATAMLGERLNLVGWIGIGTSFTGAAVIAMGDSGGLSLSWGAVLVLMAALMLSVFNVAQKPLLTRYKPLEFSTYAIWAGTLFLLPFSPGLDHAILIAPLSATLAVVYLGIGPAAIAYATWAFILSKLPASRAASFLYAIPVSAFLIAWVWLGEVPSLVDVLGGLLALAGVFVVNTWGKVK